MAEVGAGPPGDEPPPFGRSWKALYLVVLGTLAVLIGLFSVFTRVFR
jgi:hypothetical protein